MTRQTLDRAAVASQMEHHHAPISEREHLRYHIFLIYRILVSYYFSEDAAEEYSS